MNRVAVIGAGASGMMAAIWAASAGASVVLFEKNDRVGKKLLQTGNGRCNYTNRRMDSSFYRGSAASSGLVARALSEFGAEDAIRFFEGLGIRPRERNGGIYPYPDTASAVLDVLRLELSRLGVETRNSCPVESVEPLGRKGGYLLRLREGGREEADAVIVAAGGSAAPKTGSDGDSCRIAGRLGLRVVPPLPSLTFLRSPEPWFKGIAGIRAEAELSLFLLRGKERRQGRREEGERRPAPETPGQPFAVSHGELQLTEAGLSGICAFELSGLVSRALSRQASCEVWVNFLPGLDGEACLSCLEERKKAHPERQMDSFFTGLFHRNLSALFLRLCGIRGSQSAGDMDGRSLRCLAGRITALRVPVNGTGDFSRAQVTSGGVDAAELEADLMAARFPGLYFTGEAVDADGICGGYNLQWAWSTGVIAGRAAAEYARKTGADHRKGAERG